MNDSLNVWFSAALKLTCHINWNGLLGWYCSNKFSMSHVLVPPNDWKIIYVGWWWIMWATITRRIVYLSNNVVNVCLFATCLLSIKSYVIAWYDREVLHWGWLKDLWFNCCFCHGVNEPHLFLFVNFNFFYISMCLNVQLGCPTLIYEPSILFCTFTNALTN